MKDDDAAGLKAPGKLAQHAGCVSLKQEHVPTDDSIEGFLEGYLGRIAFAKRDVPGDSASARRRATTIAAGARSTNDRAFVAGQIRSQECDVAATAAYLKDSHPGDDASLDEELSGDRSYEAGLRAQTLEFPI
jgi:hypothetical protein